MSATITPNQYWNADVIEYARAHQVDEYLQPLVQITRELFPSVRKIKVSIYRDPELCDMKHIQFNVQVPASDLLDFVGSRKKWAQRLFEICPAPSVHHFGLFLETVS